VITVNADALFTYFPVTYNRQQQQGHGFPFGGFPGGGFGGGQQFHFKFN
jgi:hypothetical protein